MKANHQTLLTLWIEQNRPLPPTNKIQTFLKVLALQEKQVKCELNPARVLAGSDPSDQLQHLAKRRGDGGYLWQFLQRPTPDTPALKKIKKVRDKQGSDAQIEEIYRQYPRHVGRQAAFKAIRAAIKKLNQLDPKENAAAFLLERTKKFAASPKGNLGQYTPYPATFFNQGRYADDEAEWGETENRSGNLKRDLTVEEDTTPGMSLDDLEPKENRNGKV